MLIIFFLESISGGFLSVVVVLHTANMDSCVQCTKQMHLYTAKAHLYTLFVKKKKEIKKKEQMYTVFFPHTMQQKNIFNGIFLPNLSFIKLRKKITSQKVQKMRKIFGNLEAAIQLARFKHIRHCKLSSTPTHNFVNCYKPLL